MILAEKIIKLRKENGWSQEDLAMKMNVSRQSVSKWESMASIPDLDKILMMSQMFGVSTDYLLKDDMDDRGPELTIDPINEGLDKKHISLEEANNYLELNEKSAVKIALGVGMCIISPVLLIILSGFAEVCMISEALATGVGLTVLMSLIAIAVMIFITTGMKLGKYEFLEKELLDLEYGIAGIVETKKENYFDIHKKSIVFGVCLCIISVIPLFMAVAFTERDQVLVIMVGLMLVLVAIGVFLIVRTCIIQGGFDRLLEEGEYTPEKKMENKRNDNLSTVYWCCVVAIYLGWSFLTMNWHITWIIWPVAGVLFGAVCGIANIIRKNK